MRDELRRSGRTTRLLAEARRLATVEDRCVYVLGATAEDAKLLKREFGTPDPRVKFESPASVRDSLDWKRMRLRGAHPRCVVLVDHYAIESEFAALLEMLHRFDPTQEA